MLNLKTVICVGFLDTFHFHTAVTKVIHLYTVLFLYNLYSLYYWYV